MEWIALIVLLIVATAIYSIYQNRANQKAWAVRIKSAWGESPVREYSYEEYARISHYFERSKGDRFFIDDITWNDLEMDDIFVELNHTYSSVGEEYLYRMLRTPEFNHKELDERHRLARFFTEHEREREDVQMLYAKTGRANRIALTDYVYTLANQKPESVLTDVFQAFLLIAAIIGIFIKPQFFILVFILVLAFNIQSYYRKKAEVENFFSCIGYLLSLAKLGEELEGLQLEALNPYAAEAAAAGKAFQKTRFYASFIKTGSGLSGSLADIIMDYIRMLFHVDLIAFQKLIRQIQMKTSQIEQLIRGLGLIESCVAIASFRASLPYYCLPNLRKGDEASLKTEQIYHPMLEEPVPNDISENRSVLLTGSNASGKSTFLKTLAINCILAQTIDTVLAKSYEANYYKVYSSMALRDNLNMAESYFIVEIKSIKRILDQLHSKEPILCFVDEVLRGTNTVERIAASARILKRFAQGNAMCFAATHDIELTSLLKNDFANYHFQEEVSEKDVVFNYRLYKGEAKTRNAIKLLGIMGFEEDLIEKAEESAARFLKTGEWKL